MVPEPRLVLVVLFSSSLLAQSPVAKPGALVAVGGGGTPPEVIDRAIDLAGGKDVPVLVVGAASRREGAGEGSVDLFREHGAADVTLLDLADVKVAREQIARARLIWFGGGSQNVLVTGLREAGLLDAVRARHRSGAVIGGTSAGAACLSVSMIGGDAKTESVVRGGSPRSEGLGVWPDVIVDQHFLARRRFNRLLAAVLDGPERIGIGIDEKTAALFIDGRIEVMGASNVLIVDASGAVIASGEPAQPHAARGVIVHVLAPGERFDLPKRAEEKTVR